MIEQIEKEWERVPDRHKYKRTELCQKWLEHHDIPFSVFNAGYHFRVECFEKEIDIWPTTSKIRVGGNGNSVEQGVSTIIKTVKRVADIK